MKIEIRIDPDCTEPRAIILTAAVTREVEAAVNALRQSGPGGTGGFAGPSCAFRQKAVLWS